MAEAEDGPRHRLSEVYRQRFGEHIPLIHDIHFATTIALVVAAIELAVIAWIRKRHLDTPLLAAVFQVVVGGVLVFLAGWLIGAG